MFFRNLLKKKITLVTHDGSFHADEIFACATLLIWANKHNISIKIFRSREKEDIKEANIVLDVGGVYDPVTCRFDHHQRGGAGEHQSTVLRGRVGIPYASFGLVWKHYGEAICGDKEIAIMIENKLVIPIDAVDNGFNVTKDIRSDVPEYSLMEGVLLAFRPTWQEAVALSDKQFYEFLYFAKKILENEIKICKSILVGDKLILQEIEKQREPNILMLDESIPWEGVVSKFKKIKLVVCPKYDHNSWIAEVARDDLSDFNSNRCSFNKDWLGLMGQELVDKSGVADAVFCHLRGFLAIAKTKKGALKLAQIALQEGNS